MGERGPQPGEGGRPPTPIDLDVVRRAAGLGCTVDEIAAVLGVPRRTLYDRMEQDPEIQRALDEGRDQGRVTLRRLQWQQANAGNPTMLIWLGKQLLGQRDRHEVEQTGTQTLQFQHLVAAREVLVEINREREERERLLREPLVINGEATKAPDAAVSTPVNLFEPALE